MIRIVLFGKPLRGFYAAGHAGYDRHGRDIICAGVSALTWAAYRSLGHYGIPVRYARAEARGMLCVLASPKDGQEQVCDIVLNTLRLGLLSLSETYPDFVRVNPQDGGGNHDV